MEVRGVDIYEDYDAILKECNRLESENAALKSAVLAQQTNNSAMGAIARIASVLDNASYDSQTKITLINLIIGQLHQ